MNGKEASRQRLLWYSFYFIVSVTLLAFGSVWLGVNISGITGIVGTTIGALSLLGVGNLATKPGPYNDS